MFEHTSMLPSSHPTITHPPPCVVRPDSPRSSHELVAVGTALTRGPPHRSPHAELPHGAPASGSGCEAHVREGMHHPDLGEPPRRDPLHPVPVDPFALAAAP